MGSEGDSKPIEETVGGLVWVRRRNGSWWPGRIMGLHELPKSYLLSPRSGTPVKLLGREDASVDWYNLEKSKRVKAFRCGEYDECIEKAKASAANPNKKAVKYARREDAILHALELEGTLESDEHHVFQSRTGSSTPPKQSSWIRNSPDISSSDSEEDDMDSKECMFETNITKELSQSGLSFEDPNHVSTAQTDYLQKTRRKTPNDSEDDGSEGTKRMRGLEDLGMGVVSKRESSVHSDSEESDELVQQDSASFSEPNICCSLSNGDIAVRSKDSCLQMKKRPAQVALVHENVKRKNRCRPLTKVLESTTMVSIPVLCDQNGSPGQSSLQGAADSKFSALESTNSKKASVSIVVNNNVNCSGASCDKEASLDTGVDAGNTISDPKDSDISTIVELPENDGSDGLFDVPFVGEEKHSQDASRKLLSGASGKRSNHCGKVESISLRAEGLDESVPTSLYVDINNVNPMVAEHTSKWQLKGKRNSRALSHRTGKYLDHRDGFSQGFDRKVESDNLDESVALDSSAHWSNYMDSSNYGRRDLSSHEMRKKELYARDEFVSPVIPHRSLPYRHSRFTPHSKYQDAYVPSINVCDDSSLFDVYLEARESHRGRHVPLISLMSKLTGKAIIGRPVPVEVCDDGYCDVLLNSIDSLASSSGEAYEVPENMSDHSPVVWGRYAKLVDSPRAETGYGRSPNTHTSIKSSASPKKSPKAKKCGLLSKKTRKLSSFVAPDRREHGRNPLVENLGGPVIACVPLNIVFSRINEALNGSARSAHRKLTLGNM
ncbi:Tudor/PWWP/MBT superfamily protein [Thalictrum thalictroides]|uniref:Tudor/PWWP/MBT superfamily protein n=1 Tax=Thalictrum thalictroides TaxID=46969 RepID=A0A7J6UUA6_THATH|nr:Tudor/PWWP/MBT superfamily protein [Thalictrum thalictroides]